MNSYSGELAKPFDELNLGFGAISSPASIDRVRKQLEQRECEKFHKLHKLCDHFSIDRNDPQLWYRLSLALAEEHVPGFQERSKPGAKRKWTDSRKLELKEAVDRKIEGAGKSRVKGVTWACRNLAKQERWETLAKGKNPVEVLRHTYQEICREIKKAEQDSATP